jgi:hypothetical protein
MPKAVTSDRIPPQFPTTRQGLYIEANFVSQQDTASYVRFVHAALGYPAPSTFLNAVIKGFINGPNQFHRLTAQMVRKHMPSTLATARGHLDKTRAKPPHKTSDAVSALLRHHTRQMQKDMQRNHGKLGLTPLLPFNYSTVAKSTTIHLDYTGSLPEVGSNGTRMFMITCWGRYIHIQPLTSFRDESTTIAFKEAIMFWRGHGITIDSVRMDNQCSTAVRKIATTMDVQLAFVSPWMYS